MDFLLSKALHSPKSNYFQIGNYFLQYTRNNVVTEREILIETKENVVLGDINFSFYKALGTDITQQTIEQNIRLLNNGYIILINKINNTVFLYTDTFGFYHIFYHYNKETIIISSVFNNLINFSENKIDDFAVLDLIFFNYTLKERTILKDIKRIFGGTKVIINETIISFKTINNFADNFILKNKKKKYNYKEFGKTLSNGISQEIINKKPVYLTMSGGFDSRALLASCKFLNYNINSFTFGQKGNIEIETIKPFIDKFVEKHTFLELDKKYIDSINTIFNSFIYKNLDNPVFHSLLEFEYSNQNISCSNLLTGFMGGELILGQSVGAQVTFTKFASFLLLSEDYDRLKDFFKQGVDDLPFLNKKNVLSILDDYLSTLKEYYHKKDNSNVLRFIINEKYAKFFGAANKVFKNNHNLITPFMNVDFLDKLLKSEISFLKKKQFKKNPIAKIKSKILYAKAINYLCPEMYKSRFDRLYTIKDLCKPYLLPKVFYFYLLNHINRKNNKMYESTTRYDLWLKELVIEQFKNDNITTNMFCISYTINSLEYDNLSIYNKRDLLKVLAINSSINYINQIKK